MKHNGENKYYEYLKSDEWATMKIELISIRGQRCEVCGEEKPINLLHMHHLTYKRLFNEEPEDLQLLCAYHHWEEHMYDAKEKRLIRQKAKKKGKNKRLRGNKDYNPYRFETARQKTRKETYSEQQAAKPKRYRRNGKTITDP